MTELYYFVYTFLKVQLHKLVYYTETYNVTYSTGVFLLVPKFILEFRGSSVHWETASSFSFFY